MGEQAAVRDRREPGTPPAPASGRGEVDVAFMAGESYRITVRGHETAVDQPSDSGGTDLAPTPVELFVASLASCVGFYAGRYLARHGVAREGLAVTARYTMAADRPARVARVDLDVTVPRGLPEDRRRALHAVVNHCTVHNSLRQPPDVAVRLT